MKDNPGRSDEFRFYFFLSRASGPEPFRRRKSFLLRYNRSIAGLSGVETEGYIANLSLLFNKIQLLENTDKKEKMQTAASCCLSSREYEIADLLSAGIKPGEIAAKLGIRPTTVERHISNVYRKLNIHSRHELSAVCKEGSGND